VTYTIEFRPAAAKDFRQLPSTLKERLKPRIDALAMNPRPPGAVKLQGEDNAYRIRVGEYRIVYEVYDRLVLVAVVRIRHRREVYR
jgi:mRNA interferase RelE/StbE